MAAPIASVTPSRTSGVAPLSVVFDATGTTDADTSTPFQDLLYIWNFGDADAGEWEYGANTSQSKNFATGAIAAHVYETPGTYTWTMVVSDGTTSDTETGTVTVTDPDTVFSTTNTVVVSTGTDFTGKPTGATEVTSSDFDATLATYAGTGKRVLFKRGDTFVSSATGNLSAAGAMTVGAWGTGAKPIITSSSVAGVININNTAVNDLRVMDLDIRGAGSGDTGTAVLIGAAAIDNVTLLRLDISEIGKGFVVTAGGVPTGFVVQENTVTNYYASGGNAWFGKLFSSALLGNSFSNALGSAEHVVRIGQGVKVAVTNNTLSGAAATKHALTLRADTHSTTAEDTQYVYIAGNKFVGGLETQLLHIRPSADSIDERIYDVVVDGNWLIYAASTVYGTIITASRVHVRNNIYDMSANNGAVGVQIEMDNTAPGFPVPADNKVINNTIYSSASGSSSTGIGIDTEPTGTVVINNLMYAPNENAGDMISGTGTSPGALTPNSLDAQITGTNPQFSGPLTSPAGFIVSAASYAADGGTASYPAQKADFYVGRDTAGDNRLGALVQNGQAQRKGVAA